MKLFTLCTRGGRYHSQLLPTSLVLLISDLELHADISCLLDSKRGQAKIVGQDKKNASQVDVMMSLLLEEGPGMSGKDCIVSHKLRCSHCGAIVRVSANVSETFSFLTV